MCAAGLAAALPPGYDAIQESVRADKEAIDSLLRDFSCKHAYLDVGSNIGVQVRKLYEPDKYPKASVHSSFRAAFGDAPRCSICSIGFEPNPRHTPQLAKVQSRLRAMGAPVLFLHAAAGAADGYVEFGRLSNITRRGQTDLSASANVVMQRRWGLKNKFAVRSVDMARVLRHVDARLREGAPDAASRRIMMKLDVEGLEYAVLTHIVASQAICTVDLLVMECAPHEAARTSQARIPAYIVGIALLRCFTRSLRACMLRTQGTTRSSKSRPRGIEAHRQALTAPEGSAKTQRGSARCASSPLSSNTFSTSSYGRQPPTVGLGSSRWMTNRTCGTA